MNASNPHPRATRYRSKLREAGMRPLQIWVPDTRSPTFAEECRRQSLLAADADRADSELMEFMDAALEDMGE
jgi:hypothetical protein